MNIQILIKITLYKLTYRVYIDVIYKVNLNHIIVGVNIDDENKKICKS